MVGDVNQTAEGRRVIPQTEKMRAMHAAGVPYAQIAAKFGCSPSRVKYVVDPGLRERTRQRNAVYGKRYRAECKRQRGTADPVRDMPVYDGGDPWVEVPTVWTANPSRRNGYKCAGKGGKQEPKPERRKSKPMTRLSAIHAYLDGDRDALRVYLESVGRA